MSWASSRALKANRKLKRLEIVTNAKVLEPTIDQKCPMRNKWCDVMHPMFLELANIYHKSSQGIKQNYRFAKV